MIVLKRYQERATSEACAILTAGRLPVSIVDDPSAPADQTRCVLLEAPTGSGKTVMAGTILHLVGRRDRVLWLWVAPFAGVIGQAADVLRAEFPDLRVRDVYRDRSIADLRPNDVYVTTWGAVAAEDAASRQVRNPSETVASLDQILAVARAEGFRIGVAVDEAHHGLMNARVATAFVKTVLRPDYVILITATPDDRDVERFRLAAELPEVSRVSVSRSDAVAAGLIKPGVRAVAFAPAATGLEAPVDYARTALRYGVDAHRGITRALHAAGHAITPLMLVQVDSADGSVAAARRALEDFGIPSGAIAVHTHDEPDPDLLAITHDEEIEVLIFKMAVALGFDAPRAWTLVSMRRSRDVDFGIQVLGRVLRVDRRLQGVDLAHTGLEYGYCFVADPDVQDGIISAAEKLNALRTDIQRVAPELQLMLLRLTAATASGIDRLGRASPQDLTPMMQRGAKASAVAVSAEPSNGGDAGGWDRSLHQAVAYTIAADAPQSVDLFGFGAPVGIAAAPRQGFRIRRAADGQVYPLRTDVERPCAFRREQFPEDERDVAACVGDTIAFDPASLQALTRQGVAVVRRTADLFADGGSALSRDEVVAELAVWKLLDDGQTALFEDDYINGQSLLPVLMQRLAEECRRAGLTHWLANDERLEEGVLRILGSYPQLLRRALRECLARRVETREAAPLPAELVALDRLARSRLNLYGVVPPGLNGWERQFASWLDDDTTGTICWWHRNEPRTPHSIAICAPGTRYNFYPDFAIGVRGRATPDRVLLVETKYHVESKDSMAKARSTHKDYGSVMMLTQADGGQWWTVRYDADREQVVRHQPLATSRLVRF